MSATSETEAVDSVCAFAQGDILSFSEEINDGTGVSFGIVINADCDLENKKNDGVISYLPTYTLRSYLNKFWGPKHITSLSNDILRQIQQTCKLSNNEISDLLAWVQDESPDSIATKLIERLNLKKSTADSLSMWLERLDILLSDKEPLQKISSVYRNDDDGHRQVIKQISAGRQSIGDGSFFISEIYGQATLGYVIRLSRILSLPMDLCFSDKAKRLSSGLDDRSAIRVGRLTPTYKYRIAQLFSNQYSRIGLPNELMALSEIAIDELATALRLGR